MPKCLIECANRMDQRNGLTEWANRMANRMGEWQDQIGPSGIITLPLAKLTLVVATVSCKHGARCTVHRTVTHNLTRTLDTSNLFFPLPCPATWTSDQWTAITDISSSRAVNKGNALQLASDARWNSYTCLNWSVEWCVVSRVFVRKVRGNKDKH